MSRQASPAPSSSISINSSNLPPAPSRAATLNDSNKKDLAYRFSDDSKKLSQLDFSLPGSRESLHEHPQELDSVPCDDYEEEYVEFNLGGDNSGIVSSKLKRNSTAELIKYGKGNKTSSSLDVSSAAHPVPSNAPSEAKSVSNSDASKGTNTNHNANVANDDKNIKSDMDPILSDDESDLDDDLDWRQMNTELEIDVYNEKGELIANDEVFLQNNKDKLEDGSKLGYTRISAEEQVTKFKKMNEEFEFLFSKNAESDNFAKLHNSKTKPVADSKIYFNIDDYQNHNSTDNLNQPEEELTPLSQLSSTKEMLKDSQKIAYVGLVKLTIVEMAIQLSKIKVSGNSVKLNKKISTAHLNFQQWSIRMMDRIYDHMELNETERKMIETLSSHGLEPKDLISSLITVETFQNPLLNDQDTKYIKDKGDDLDSDVLKVDIKWTLVCDLFLNLVFDAVYDSRSRILLLKFGESLGISHLEIFQFERRITDLLEIEESSEQIWNEQEILDYRAKANRKKKLMYVGLATIGGSLVIGLSAGLLAPVIGAGIAAGLSTVGIAGTSGFLAGVGGTSIVTTVGVLSGARIGSKGMAKRVGNVKTFEFRPIHNNRRVNLILTVSGWMNGNEDDVRLPFSTVDPVMGDIYSVLWEPDMLKSTGATINILATEILTQSIQQILGSTVLIAFMASIQWPMALSKLGYLLDNPWSVSLDRAWAAGIILADTLIQRNLGVRPVTLVGFSLGARLIYSCLLELNKRGAYGLVEDVILFGSPLVFKADEISLCRSVVSGRYVNGFSKKDWILGYLFRATSGGLGRVAGLAAIEGIEGIENLDCTEYVSGHMEYRKQMPKLLKELDWEILNEEFVEIDEPENAERQRELIDEFESVKDNLDKKQGKKKNFISRWFKPQKKEWWEVYDEGRKEVEEKQRHEAEAAVSSEETASAPKEALFDVDEIAKEVVKIEQELDKDVDKTPILSNGEFQSRSFKTGSVESTPKGNENFTPRPFKSPSLHKSGVNEVPAKKSTRLLQQVIFDRDGNNDTKVAESEPEIVKPTDGTSVEAQPEKVEEKEAENKADVDNRPRYDYDDDDEFNTTGQEIKMSFA